MATKKRTKRLSKKEMKFILRRLKTCDVEVMEAFVVKFIDERELHVAVHPTRQKLWMFLRCESKLPSVLN